MVRVAVIGAGPTGLEAALAAQERGWGVSVYEKAAHVAGHVRDWGHVRMFTPWPMNVSPRVARHLPSVDTGCPSGADFADHLERVAALLPSGTVQVGTTVTAIARDGLLKSDEIGTALRADRPFRLLVRNGTERVEVADVVLDCGGTWSNPLPLGRGGIPAPGEQDVSVIRRVPEVDETWAGRRVLLVGAGNSAQTAARDLVAAGVELTWVVRRPAPDWGAVPGDVLPDRAALAASSRALTQRGLVRTGLAVDALRRSEAEVVVTLRDDDGRREEVRVDAVLSLVGASPDAGIYRQLQVHECYATEGVMSLAATLLAGAGTDCLTQTTAGVDSLRNPEPRFFILGSKSYGRNNSFLLRIGWEQVEQVFEALDAELAA